MCAARKFLFETCFDEGSEEQAVEETEAVVEAPPISPEEVAAARAEGYAAGHLAGSEEERRATGRLQAEAAHRVATRLAEIDAELEAVCETAPRQAVAIALAAARRILPELVRREGTREIEALIRECLRDLIDEPRMVLRIGEAAFDTIDQILTSLTTAAGFSGRVILLADEALGPSDCLIEWADGGAERDVGRAWREIDQTVERILSAPRVPARDDAEPAVHHAGNPTGDSDG